jgi:hypothetical protein
MLPSNSEQAKESMLLSVLDCAKSVLAKSLILKDLF